MTMAKNSGLIVSAFAIATALGVPAIAQDDPIELLWVQPVKDSPVHKIMQAGFLTRCKELGYVCEIVGDPSATNWDVSATLALAEAALARTSFDAVGVYAIDPAFNPFIAELDGEGLPVAAWHVLPAEGAIPGLDAAVGHDIPKAGAAAAEAIAAKLGGEGVVALTQSGSNETENAMGDAFRAAMKERFPNITVLPVEYEGLEPSAAKAKAVAILLANPEIKAAFGTTGNSIQTWVGAAEETGQDGLVIIGMDYLRQNLDLVRDGRAYGIVAQPLYEESAAVADLLGALARGEPVSYRNVLPAPVITAENLDPFYAMLEAAGQ